MVTLGLASLILGIVLVVYHGQVEGQQAVDGEENITEADYFSMVHIYHGDVMSEAMPQSAQGGQQAPPFGYRPGSATTTNTCQQVRAVPSQLRSGRVMKPRGLASFYQKYTEAYGIPVLASRRVPDDALRRACYTLRFLLASHSGVRNAFYRLSGRVAVIGKDEGTNWIPEHSNLPNWWNQRARGLGATPHGPVSTGGEENVLCYQTDRYRAQDIFLHESAHGVHLLGAAYGISGWDRRLRSLYNQAKRQGLWANTYSMSTPEEYFAEGTQAYFYVQSYAPRPDGVRGPTNTRPKLRRYDPRLYAMIEEVFPCDNTYLKRCESTRQREDAQVLMMDCDIHGKRQTTTSRPATTTTTTTATSTRTTQSGRSITTPRITPTTTTTSQNCTDIHQHCQYWASVDQCSINPAFMKVNCKQSCNMCPQDCRDKSPHCGYWAGRGECDNNPTYMNTNCRSSCEIC